VDFSLMDPINKNAKGWILVVDDEPLKRITLQIELTEAGYQVYEAAEAKTALRVLEARPIDVVVTDLRMPGMDGLMFLEHVKQRRPDVHVILMTAYGTVDTAVAAMKRGAYDYLTKPFTTDVLLSKIDHLLAYRRTLAEPAGEPDEGPVVSPDRLGRLIGHSHAMRSLIQQVRTVADSERTILICGESGTGKELLAEAIHELSRRREKPLVKFSCAALQPNLLESELFGHEKGAFTSALARRLGRFELADQGTLFLDEVDDIPLEIQVKMLRAIEEQAFERVGGEEVVRVNVRLICATKKNLRELVDAGKFREDLYYRLNVINLTIPSLRDRREDIPVLAAHFIEKHAPPGADGGRPTLSPHALDLLMDHYWPGNVRELEHVIERALAFCGSGEIGPEHIPALTDEKDGGRHVIPFAEVGAGLTETVASIEKRMIESALIQADYNQAKAAQILGIPRTTLRDKIAKYGVGSGPATGGGNPSSAGL
jgi:DNA-binding NtrC family response regulator